MMLYIITVCLQKRPDTFLLETSFNLIAECAIFDAAPDTFKCQKLFTDMFFFLIGIALLF